MNRREVFAVAAIPVVSSLPSPVLSKEASDMLNNFVVRSDARYTYIEDFLKPQADELILAGYIKPSGIFIQLPKRFGHAEKIPVYDYTKKLLALRV